MCVKVISYSDWKLHYSGKHLRFHIQKCREFSYSFILAIFLGNVTAVHSLLLFVHLNARNLRPHKSKFLFYVGFESWRLELDFYQCSGHRFAQKGVGTTLIPCKDSISVGVGPTSVWQVDKIYDDFLMCWDKSHGNMVVKAINKWHFNIPYTN